jgi:methyltransferase (TIGR00027 family)
MPSSPPVTHVSDTALWVAMYRAMESDRPDALFRDPYARKLAGERGAAIVNAMPKGRQYAWPMIVRTAVMDEIIMRTITRDGARLIVNLAAGLDTRAYRLDLPPDLVWLDVDYPDVQAYKREAIAGETPRCRLEWVPADLSDETQRRTVLDRIAAGPGPALAVSEGLLIYLTPEQVAALGRALQRCAPLRWWMADLASPRLLKMMEKNWGRGVAAGAPFRFAPADGPAFFAELGWREIEWRSLWDESRFSGISLMEKRA